MASETDIPRIMVRSYSGFPKFEEGMVVETIPFLAASKEIISAIESFGKLFSPIVNDMRNNVERINSVYQQDPEKYQILDELLACEKSRNSDYAGNSLLWLVRALQLISVFFYNIIHDSEEKNALKDALKDAYNKTLKQYHKWIVQNAFALIYRWVPTREQLFGTCDIHTENMKLLEPFQQRMHLYLKEVRTLIVKHDLDDQTPV